jgi:hypothetical protein
MSDRTSNERVKRYMMYATTEGYVEPKEAANGGYVLTADYEWLRAERDRLRLVFEEACNEVKMCHDKPCFCKYCYEGTPDETKP